MKITYLKLLLVGSLIYGTSCASYNKDLKNAKQQLDMLNYKVASENFNNAWQKQEDPEIARGLAFSHYKMRDFTKAASWYAVLQEKGSLNTEDYYQYAESLIANAKFDEASKLLDELAAKSPAETASPKWKNLNKSSKEAKELLNAPSDHQIKPLNSLNTSFSEFGLTKDLEKIYFSSDRITGSKDRIDVNNSIKSQRYGWTGNGFLSVFEGTFNETSKDVENIIPSKEFQNDLHIGPIHKAGDWMFYTVTEAGNVGTKGRGKDLTLYPEIRYKRKTGSGPFSEAKSLSVNAPLAYGVSDPYWNEATKRLYFASDMPGGMGGTDLYYMEYLGNDQWSHPVNLGEKINTYGNERSPLWYEGEMFFASDGMGGLGGLDIYKATYNENAFSEITNLGVPFNSNKDDFFYFQDTTLKDKIFITSDRAGSKGLDDIYLIEKMEEKFFTIKGSVKDNESGEPIPGAVINFTDLNNVVTSVVSDEDGVFSLKLPLDNEYVVQLDKTGYFSQIQDGVSTKPTKTNMMQMDILAEKIVLNKGIRIRDIYYDFDKSDIRPDAESELYKIISVLNENPQLRVLMFSHTDSRGKTNYNLKLSDRRAKSVIRFLGSDGIATNRMKYKAFGESKLVNECEDGIECSEEEHQLNRRTEFVIMNLASFNKNHSYESFIFEDPIQKERIETLAILEYDADDVDPSYYETNFEDVVTTDSPSTSSTAKPTIMEGVVESSNFSNHYIVVESWQTPRMAKMRAEELAKNNQVYIIPPFGNSSNYRIAVAVYPGLEQAARELNRVRVQFDNQEVWVLAY